MRAFWTEEEDSELRLRYADELTEQIAHDFGRTLSAVYGRAKRFGLHKSDTFVQEQGRIHARHPKAVEKRFTKGMASWNKGMKGICTGGVETQFKKGHRGGRALENYQPIGTERITKDGYLERKINDDMPLQKRWRAVHLLNWEAVNGPLPKGYAIRFKDGNKANTQLDNLELISRADNMRRNTIHRYPPELRVAMRTIGRIKRQLKNQPKEDEHE